MRSTILAIGLTLAIAAPALAQNANSQKPPQNHQAQAHPQNLQQEVQNNLKSAGFTDIKIMPESFLVRAKDKSGNPVMMVINPDSDHGGDGRNEQAQRTEHDRQRASKPKARRRPGG